MQSIYGVRKTEDAPQQGVPKSLLTNSNRGVIYQQRGIGRQISSWLLEPVKLQGGSTSSSSYAVDIKKSLPKLGADQAKHQARGGRSALPKQAGTVLPSISGKLNPYRTSDIKFLKSQYNGKGQRGENPPSGTSPGKRKKGKRTRSPPNKTRLQSKVEIYSTHAAKPAKKPAKLKPSKKIKGQPLPKTFHTSNIATRAKLLTVFLRQSGQNVDLLEDTLQFVSQETKHDILMRHAKVLMRNQFYFSSIRIVHMQQDSLGAVLKELMQKISGSMQSSDGWNWNLVDHELFIKQFGDLKILQQYRGVRKKLLGMGENGVIALARVEKEILLKVVSDFMEQLSLPTYQKTVVSELMLEETGAKVEEIGGKSRLKKKREPEPEPEEAEEEEEFSLKASKDAKAKPKEEEEEEKPAPPAPEESEPPAAEEEEPKPAEPEPEAAEPEDAPPPAPPAQDVETLKEEKSWQEIEKERLEAEMRAVTEEMEKEEAAEAPAAEPEAEPEAKPEAEAEGKPAEPPTPEATPPPPPADSTPAPPDAPAPAEEPEEPPAPAEDPVAKAEEQAPPPPPPAEEKKADAAPPPPPPAVETPPPPPPVKEAEPEAEPVLSERELLEKEREAMQRELQELEAAEEEESADVPPPAEKEETKEEEAKPSVKSVEDEEAKKEEERKKKEEQIQKDKEAMEKEMKALKEKEEAEAKAKAEAEEQAAIKIQSRGRAMLAKKRVEKKKEAVKEEQAAIKIQSRGRAMLAKKKVEKKKSEKMAALKKKEAEAKPEPAPEPTPAPEPEVKAEPEPAPAPEPEPEPAPAPEPEAAEDDIEKLKQQALEEQKRIAKEEGVDFESTLTKPVEEEDDEEIVIPPAASVTAPFEKEIAKAQEAAASPVPPVAAETKEKPVVQESFEDVVAREEEKQEKAEQDIEQAIKRMREEMRQEKERLRKEMEEKRRKLQEARQRKRESATWKKTPVTIVPTESPLKTVKESLKLDEPIKLTVDDIPKAKEPEPKEETGPVPIRPEPVSVVKMPMEPPKPKEPEAPKAGGVVEKASFEKEIHQALQQVQEQLAMQQQQFLQMQFTNMQMATPGMPGITTPGGPVPMNRGGMPMATPGMQQLGQTANTNPPTQEEINEYAVYLGMDPVQDKDLLYIAEWALSAPLPEGWTEHVDTSGNEFYFNSMTGVSTYEHPLDGQFREYYRQQKVMAVAK